MKIQRYQVSFLPIYVVNRLTVLENSGDSRRFEKIKGRFIASDKIQH